MTCHKSNQMEKEIAVSDERIFSLMFEQHAAIMLLIEPKTGVILDANQAAENFYGYPKSKLRGMSINDINILPPGQVDAERQKAFREEQNDFIFPHRLSNGEERIVEVHSSPIAFQEKQVLCSIIYDITDRKRTENALRESEARYHRLVEGAPDVVYTFSSKRGGIYYSPHVEQVLGYPLEHLYSHPFLWNESIHPDDRTKISDAIHEFEIRKSFDVEYRIKDAQGGWHWLRDRSIGRYIADDEVLIEGLATDITERKQAEISLREKEARIKSISNNFIGGMIYQVVIKPDGVRKFTYLSDSVQRLYGISPEEGMADANLIYSRVHKDDIELLTKAENESVRTLSVFKAEARMKNPSGEIRWSSFISTPKMLEDGSICFDGIEFIITARKQAEEELRASEEHLQLALSGAEMGMWNLNVKTMLGTIDDRAAQILGYTKDVIPQEKVGWDGLTHPDDVPRIGEILAAHLAGRIPIFESEHRMRHASGGYRWVSGRGKITHFDTDGTPLQISGTIVDITERKRMEQELQAQHDFATQIINLMGQGLTVTDAKGKFEFVNPAYERLFGYESADMIGKDPWDITVPEDHAMLDEQKKQRQAGKTTTYESRLHRADGSLAQVLITGVPRGRDGQYAGAIAVITDLTEQKLVEEELRSAKDALEIVNHNLEQTLLREQMLSHTDGLTGINNRRNLFELAEQKLAVATRYRQPLAVMMIDIDHFKQVNDIFGHNIGDQMLVQVTQIASAELRRTDVIGRYGGEEFIILLPMTNAPQACLLAERIRTSVAALRVPSEKGDASVTLSIGIVETALAQHSESVEDVFRRADKAMYHAKDSGRNRTVILGTN